MDASESSLMNKYKTACQGLYPLRVKRKVTNLKHLNHSVELMTPKYSINKNVQKQNNKIRTIIHRKTDKPEESKKNQRKQKSRINSKANSTQIFQIRNYLTKSQIRDHKDMNNTLKLSSKLSTSRILNTNNLSNSQIKYTRKRTEKSINAVYKTRIRGSETKVKNKSTI